MPDLAITHPADAEYQRLLGSISEVYSAGQLRAVQAVNAHLTETYWQIGHDIIEFEQGGKAKAEYGKGLLTNLSRDLTRRHGKGFSRSNLSRFRQFYLAYPICAKASHKLSWSHYSELLKLEDPLERSFYEQQSMLEKWSVPELQRHKKSSLFLRLAAGKDKDAILQLASQGQIIASPSDLLRDPYVFEFLKIPEPHTVSETDLETLLCDHLQPFLLELGKGFTFVGRQYRITLNNTHYRVDLVFYHRILRCFVLIDLKINEVEYHDIGQIHPMRYGYIPIRLRFKKSRRRSVLHRIYTRPSSAHPATREGCGSIHGKTATRRTHLLRSLWKSKRCNPPRKISEVRLGQAIPQVAARGLSHGVNMYLGYFATEENTEGDNPPIGIILTLNKDELLVEYATYQMNSQLFVQKYQLYLPDREELRRELELTLQLAEERSSQEN
jgi:predicted nuclease of restriction endonuclease-like (RecB) superfamily